VAVDELVRAVAIAGGALPLTTCAGLDTDGDGAVSIAEVIGAVAEALNGCAAAPPPG
jgi:hypothetical protein